MIQIGRVKEGNHWTYLIDHILARKIKKRGRDSQNKRMKSLGLLNRTYMGKKK